MVTVAYHYWREGRSRGVRPGVSQRRAFAAGSFDSATDTFLMKPLCFARRIGLCRNVEVKSVSVKSAKVRRSGARVWGEG